MDVHFLLNYHYYLIIHLLKLNMRLNLFSILPYHLHASYNTFIFHLKKTNGHFITGNI